MAPRRASRPSGDDPEELARVPLQAVLLADSFTQKFRPITLERPKVLLPLVNVPMIEYSMTWLESVGVEEVFVFCCAHARQVKDYLEMSGWLNQSRLSVTAIEAQDSIGAGDALRVIYNKSVIRGDFILISGDTVSNACLTRALEEHKERRKKDPKAIMTMLIERAKPSSLTQQSRLGNDEIFMAIDPETKQLLYYEDKADYSKSIISLDKTLLSENPVFCLHNDKQDCYIDICSQDVPSLFADNFDYQHLRRHFVKGLLVDDIMGYKIFTHELHGGYAARVDNFRSYDTASKDILQRWTYPFVPDVQFSGKCRRIILGREGIYRAPEIAQSHSAHIGAFSFIGNGAIIGDNTMIFHSVIGEGCVIGRNVLIENSYIWDNVTIENDCKISHAIVCDGALLKAGAVLEPGVILSFKVVVGPQCIVPAYSKVSLCPQPSIQDSDEELECSDSNATSLADTSIAELASVTAEDGISGHGLIWTAIDGGSEEELRHSVAPLPAEKLREYSVNVHGDPDSLYQDAGKAPASGYLQPESESTDSGDSDNEHHQDIDFEGEVEATFCRAVDEGINEENVILEVNSLKLAYNVEHKDCAGALFYAIMKLALTMPHSTHGELLVKAKEVLGRWKSLLKHYLKTVDEEVEVILKFEEMCLDIESTREFSPCFASVLNFLYFEDIATEDAILTWAREKGGAEETDKVLLRQSESFIQWLQEADEEE